MIREGYRPFQPQGVSIPLEKVGVRGSERRPGERRLNLVRPAEPEQPKTLLQEMQQYFTDRQVLRANGYFVAAGQEPRIDIPRADAIHNDLHALVFIGSPELPGNARQITDRVDIWGVKHVFEVYAVGKMSPEKQRDILEMNERFSTNHRRLKRERPHEVKGLLDITHEEIETVRWLLKSVGVKFEVPESDTAIPFAHLLMETRRRASM